MTDMTREEIKDYLNKAKYIHDHRGPNETFCLRVSDMEAITILALQALDAHGGASKDEHQELFDLLRGRSKNGKLKSKYLASMVRSRIKPTEPDPTYHAPSKLCALSAATISLVQDEFADLPLWLAEELVPTFSAQLNGRSADLIRDIEVLRDPFSTKPYIMFYCTAKLPSFPTQAEDKSDG